MEVCFYPIEQQLLLNNYLKSSTPPLFTGTEVALRNSKKGVEIARVFLA